MKPLRIWLAAVVVAAAGGALALAQNADPNTAGPTKNDYRLRIVEPVSGAVITGSTVRVVVDASPMPELGGEKKDVNSMPGPDVKVFLDNEMKGTLRSQNNVMTLDNVAAGDHKLVFVATNRSGEVIDREEVPFRSEAAVSASVAPAPAPRAEPAPAPAPAYHPPAPAPAQEIQARPAAPPPPPPAPMHEMRTESKAPRTLPKTASSNPLLLVGGLSLIGAGLLTRRLSL